MKMRFVLIAALLSLAGFAAAGALANDPPGRDPCSHGKTNKPCKDDPQPDHGKECKKHGKNGGVNEDHCKGTTTTDTTTTTGTTTQSTTTETTTVGTTTTDRTTTEQTTTVETTTGSTTTQETGTTPTPPVTVPPTVNKPKPHNPKPHKPHHPKMPPVCPVGKPYNGVCAPQGSG